MDDQLVCAVSSANNLTFTLDIFKEVIYINSCNDYISVPPLL